MFHTKFKNHCTTLGLVHSKRERRNNTNSDGSICVGISGRPDYANTVKQGAMPTHPFIYDEQCEIFMELYFTKDGSRWLFLKKINMNSKEFFCLSKDDIQCITDHLLDIKELYAKQKDIQKRIQTLSNTNTMKRVFIRKLHTFEDMMRV